MRSLKIVVAFIGCLMLSETVEGVVTRTSEELDDLTKRLGTAAYVAFEAREEGAPNTHTLAHGRVFLENAADFQALKDLQDLVFARSVPKLPEDEARQKDALAQWKETCARIGRKYIEDPRPLLDVLENLTEGSDDIERVWPVAYYRAYFLLDGIGVEEGEEDAAKAKAFTLIERILASNHSDSGLELLFKHFLPDNPLALEHLKRLEETVAKKDKESRKYDPNFLEKRPLRSDVQLLEAAHKVIESQR